MSTVSAAHAPVPLRAEGLAAGYFGHPVVSDVSLDVGAGEVVALLGANGAGKTTTIRALMGTIPPLAGSIMIDGRATTAPPHRRAKAGVAIVTEQRSVFMRTTVRDNLRLGRGDNELALTIFPELRPLLGRLAGQLSGGEQQMLTLARALSRRPRVLLADELSLGLAPLVVRRLLETVRRAADEESLGVLLVEQHVRQALRYADRVVVLRRGSVVLSGPVAEVAGQIEDAYLTS
jgi:branched-chain amino acid transport system ATP-binding protein